MSVLERAGIVAVVLITVAVVVWTTARSYRRGGYGPRIRMPALTRRGRERTNRVYREHGWAEPYDESGRLLPASERELPNHASDT